MFAALNTPPEDSLHAVMGRYNADPRPNKIDLGVGVYRDAHGRSPIMECVAEGQRILERTETSKSYLALRGDERFLEQMAHLTFNGSRPQRMAAIQTVGGTGGVRMAIELAKNANPDLTVYVGVPTWPNHLGICHQLQVSCETYNYFNTATQKINQAATFSALANAKAGDVFVLHGPCHNPTGADLSIEVVIELVEAAAAKGVIPLVDAAYYGLGNPIDEDLRRLANLLHEVPRAALVLSCSKTFGLYRERTGVLFLACSNLREATVVQATLEYIARGNYSMPPSHGAAVVGEVLGNDTLNAAWQQELTAMRQRIKDVRHALSTSGTEVPALSNVGMQKGIFSLLPLTPEHVALLADNAAIYMPQSGRINLAGLKQGDIDIFVDALKRL